MREDFSPKARGMRQFVSEIRIGTAAIRGEGHTGICETKTVESGILAPLAPKGACANLCAVFEAFDGRAAGRLLTLNLRPEL